MGKHWKKLKDLSSWRKISVGMWGPPDDPTIYGHETLNVEKTLKYLDDIHEQTGNRVSMTALDVAAFATVYKENPHLNVMVVNRRVVERQSIDAFCQVAIPNEDTGKADLSGVKLKGVGDMDPVQISDRLRRRAKKVRAGEDVEIEESKAIIDFVPSWFMRPMIKTVDFLTFNVPIDLDAAKIRSDPFGSFMVSSIAAFDLKLGYAPLVPASRCPLVALPGAVHDVVMPIDGEPKVVKGLTVAVTFDHRCFDGYQIGVIVRRMRDLMQDPETHFGPAHQFADRHAIGAEEPMNVEETSKEDKQPAAE